MFKYIIFKYPNIFHYASPTNIGINLAYDLDPNYIEDKPENFVRLELNKENQTKFCGEKRIFFGEDYENSPIILIGCSYAYGHGLKREESFPYLLSEMTQRPVYNFSKCGFNPIQSIDLMKNYIQRSQYIADTIKKSDYIVFLYMFDHVNRFLDADEYFTDIYNRYHNPSIINKAIEHFSVFKYLYVQYQKRQIYKNFPDSGESSIYLKNAILYLYEQTKKYAPEAQFIIIIYDEKIIINDFINNNMIKYVIDIQNSGIWQELEKETNGGIKIIHTKDLTGFLFDKNWKLMADCTPWHPNEKVWKYFTPLFVKEYIK